MMIREAAGVGRRAGVIGLPPRKVALAGFSTHHHDKSKTTMIFLIDARRMRAAISRLAAGLLC